MAPGITWWVKARLITFLNRHEYRYGKEKHREDEFKGWFNKKELYSQTCLLNQFVISELPLFLKFLFLAFMR